MIIGLHHVQIGVAPESLAECRHFYVELLGLTEIPDPFSLPGFWLAAGQQQIHVRPEAGVDRSRTNAHAALFTNDIEGIERRLLAAGFKIIPQPLWMGYQRFHVIDPGGNRVEVLQADVNTK